MEGALRRFCTSCGSALEGGAPFCHSCGTPSVTLEEGSQTPEATDPRTEIRDPYIGTELAGYRIEAQIGQGGMGVVYRARQLRLDRYVALKLIAPGHVSKAQFRDRFVAESRAAAAIDHPNILPLYEADEHDGHLYMVTRLVEGTDLKELLAAEGALEPRRAILIVSQIGAALDAAHARGLVHRDIKPANVLIEPGAGPDGSDHAYLTDFGLTKRLSGAPGLTQTGQFVGTIDYVAPEQIEGRALDGRADVYSLGCMLYECLTGKAPYPRDSEATVIWAHLNASPPRLSAARPELPPSLDDVVAMAMAKDPEERFARCNALTSAAREELAMGDAPPPPPPPAPDLPPAGVTANAPEPAWSAAATQSNSAPPPSTRGRLRARKWAARALLAALLVAGGIVVGALVVSGGPDEEATTVPVVETKTVPAPASTPAPNASRPATPVKPGEGSAPPADVDTLSELKQANDVDDALVYATFGTQTIAGNTYDGVSISVERRSGDPVTIDTKGRYKRLSGIVGINDNADCGGTPANVSLTKDDGQTIWGPERVTISSPKKFDVSIRGLTRVKLAGVSLAKSDDDDCGGDANPAWGDVKFTK